MRIFIGALLLFATSGCFDTHHGKAKTAENIERTEEVATPSGTYTSTMKAEGSAIAVTVNARCAVVEQQTVKITTKYAKNLDDGASAFLTALAIIGSVPLTAGVVLLADSPNVYQADPHSRLYNPTGKDTVIGTGIALTAAGAAAFVLPIGNGIHALGSDEETSTTTRRGKTLKSDAPCDSMVSLPAHSVVAKGPNGQSVPLGATDGSGRMSASLKEIFARPGVFGNAPLPVSMGIYVDNQFVGEIQTSDIMREVEKDRGAQDDATWNAAGSDLCAREHTEQACARVRQYRDLAMSGQVTGGHAQAAGELLAKVTKDMTVAAGANGESLLQSAVQAAQAASASAAQKVIEAADAAQKKALLKAQEDAQRAGKTACEATCKQVCETPLKSGKAKPEDAATCRTTCVQEACP